jgi:hypothetical protein
MLTACLPWLAALGVSFLLAYFLLRMSRARLQLGRIKQLHRDQAGGVQSLSFVLTLPIFLMVMMLIVQVSQLMIGVMVVHYAAFAAARSAIVWIPADLRRFDPAEGPNCISLYIPDLTAENQTFLELPAYRPILNDQGQVLGWGYARSDYSGPLPGGVTYLIAPSGPKYDKIRSAAVLACMPISPSRPMGDSLESAPDLLGPNAHPASTSASDAALILQEAYLSMSPASATNTAVPERLRNKLAYALRNTAVEVRFYHQNFEPPLQPYPFLFETELADTTFKGNEVGRQDLVTVKVTHNFALLPGPGRLLARYGLFGQNTQSDAEARRGSKVSVYKDTYSYAITASAALNVEGDKSVISYVY